MRPLRSASLACCLLAACSSPPKSPPAGDAGTAGSGRPLPPVFLWGVSTAAEQSEGGNTTNDWHVFAGMGKVPPVGMADDMWDRYDTDFANAQGMGANEFRLTFEWARLMPRRPADPAHPTEADLDPTALDHYRAVVASLKSHGLTPVVTLTHYTVPAWIDNPAAYDADKNLFTDGSPGAWLSPQTAVAFGGYAGLMAQEFGGEVTYWLTENEPEVDLIAGYLAGIWPPGLALFSLTEKTLPGGVGLGDVLRNMIAGHAAAFHAIKAVEPAAKVSLAHNSIAFEPYTQRPADVAAEKRVEFLYDFLYLDAATSGNFDTSLVGNGPLEYHADWKGTLDFIGVNFYAHDVAFYYQGLLPPLEAIPCDVTIESALGGILNGMGCPTTNPPEPVGLTDLLVTYGQRYHLPILITENVGNDPDPRVKASYLVQNVLALEAAAAQGVSLLGYSYWTLNDDYEWQSGYGDSFGLFAVAGMHDGPDGGLPAGVDGGPWEPGPSTDFTRVPRTEATRAFSAIADAGYVPESLAAEYAPDGGD